MIDFGYVESLQTIQHLRARFAELTPAQRKRYWLSTLSARACVYLTNECGPAAWERRRLAGLNLATLGGAAYGYIAHFFGGK